MAQRRPVLPPKRVDDALLSSGVALMTGGADNMGRPLLVFPCTTSDLLLQRFSSAHLVLLLQYYVTLGNDVIKAGGFGVIANFWTYNKEAVRLSIDTLDKLQAEVCGSVGVLYAVVPKSKEVKRSMKKLVGLKPSKGQSKVATFETVCIDGVPGLQAYIRRNQLTSDLGGTLTYNHRTMTQLIQELQELEEGVEAALGQLPAAQDKVNMLTEYDVPEDVQSATSLLELLTTKYNTITGELNLEDLIDGCRQLHERLQAPHKYEGLNDITHTHIFIAGKVRVSEQKQQLTEARENFKLLWQHTEGRIQFTLRIQKYKAKADKVIDWMHTVGLPTVNQDPEIADSISKAEILKNHFETGFLTIAQRVLWLSDKIQHKLEGVLQEVQPGGMRRGATGQVEKALSYTRQFQATSEYFKRAVEKKHQVYINVYEFFQSAVKESSEDREASLSIYRQLQQLTKWYRKTLRFLPVQLLVPGTKPYVSSAWTAAIEDYNLHNPLPSANTLNKMKNLLPVIDNVNVRNQARLLISRVQLMRTLLVTPAQLSQRDIQDIQLWKCQLAQGEDIIHINVNMTTSTLDLTKTDHHLTTSSAGGFSAREHSTTPHNILKSDSRVAEDTYSRAPKLRTMFADEQNKVYHPHHHRDTHNERYGALRPVQSELNIFYQTPYTQQTTVPPLDLRQIAVATPPPTIHPHTDRSPFERQKSFGIYGNIDNPLRKGKHAKSNMSLESHQESVKAECDIVEKDERYISLNKGSEQASHLPSSLKHINVGALKDNVPQVVGVHRPGSSEVPRRRMQSTISAADSGIGAIYSSTEASSSGSTNSPNHHVSTMSAVLEQQDESISNLVLSKQPGSVPPKSRSLSNLKYSKDGKLSLSQPNIDTIVGSSQLTADEKLQLMATMCECESVVGSKGDEGGQHPIPDHPTAPGDMLDPQQELLHKLNLFSKTFSSDLGKAMEKDLIPEVDEEGVECGAVASVDGGSTVKNPNRTPKLTGAKSTDISTSASSSVTFHAKQSKEMIPPPPSIPPPPPPIHQHHSIATNHSSIDVNTETKQQDGEEMGLWSLKARYPRSFEGYGIDIEAWMRAQEVITNHSQMEADVSASIAKLKNAKEDRLSEERELMKAQEALQDLMVKEEELQQQDVARSLARTQRILQEREASLNGLDTGTRSGIGDLTSHHASGSDDTATLSSGSNTPSASSSSHVPLDSSPQQSPTRPHRRWDVCESSMSSESGVFTQSSDSQQLKAVSSPYSTPRHGSTSHQSDISNKLSHSELLQAAIDTNKSLPRAQVNPGSRSKSGIVQQMDFRDMLRSVSLEKDDDEDDDKEPEPECYTSQLGSPPAYKISDHSIYIKQEEVDLRSGEGSISIRDSMSELSDYSFSGEGKLGMSSGKQYSTVDDLTAISCASSHIGGSELENEEEEVCPSDDTTPVNTPRDCIDKPMRGNSGLPTGGVGRCGFTGATPNKAIQDEVETTIYLKPNPQETQCALLLSNSSLISTASSSSSLGRPKAACSQNDESSPPSPPPPGHIDANMLEEEKVKEVKGQYADMKVKVQVVSSGGGGAYCGPPVGGAISLSSSCMQLENLKTPIVLDNGSGMCKCGFAGEELPSAIFPALVGRPKYEDISMGREEEVYVGSAAQSMRGVLRLQYPLEHGIITEWSDMELIWEHAFSDQLRVTPSEHPVLVTEAPLNPLANREKMAELLFETFDVPGVYIAIQAVLALYASGRTTGMVVDIGDGVSHFVPIYEGCAIPHAIQRVDLAGRDLTHYLATLLYERGHKFTSSAELEIVRDMKESLCYVAADPQEDMRRSSTSLDLEKSYTLPDGRQISVGSERFRCAEVLFEPMLVGREHGGIHEKVCSTVMKCDIDLRQDLFSNVILSGGTTMLPGLQQRLEAEICDITPSGQAVCVAESAERYFSVWRGGAMLASLPSFTDSWIARQEYFEYGDTIVHKKCF